MSRIPRTRPLKKSYSTGVSHDPTYLQMLGRRIERLLFIGLLLTGLSFSEMYMSAASLQFSHDQTYAALEGFVKRLQTEKIELDRLFREKPQQLPTTPPPPPDLSQLGERERLIANTRKRIGLPPEQPKPKSDEKHDKPTIQPRTYAEALKQYAENSSNSAAINADVLAAFVDPKISPGDIILKLKDNLESIDRQPISVWGIRSPRLIQIGYAGASFQFPYLFLSTAFLILILALISGWLSALYMARQREIYEIVRTKKISLIFPHILNFIPVQFMRFSAEVTSPRMKTFSIVFMTIVRLMVLVVIIAPMLVACANSVLNLWSFSQLIYIAGPFLLYMGIQFLALILQELFGLRSIFLIED